MSSKRHQRRRGCENKVRHHDRAGAKVALDKLRRSKRGVGESWGWQVYQCSSCGGWHVGRPPRRVKQARKAAADARRRSS